MTHIWPQVTYLALACAGMGMALAKYGETKVTKYDWTDFAATGLTLVILYCGGFFAPLGG